MYNTCSGCLLLFPVVDGGEVARNRPFLLSLSSAQDDNVTIIVIIITCYY